MEKIILLIVLFTFLVQPAFGKVDAEDSAENSNIIKCDQVDEIINSGDCKNWIIKSAVGIWCNLPMSQETVAQFDNYYAPTYVFAPGEICAEPTLWKEQTDQTPSGDEGTESDQNPPLLEDEENMFKKALGEFPVLIGEWFQAISSGIKLNAFLDSIEALMKHSVTLELTDPKDLEEYLSGGGPFAGARKGWVRELGIDIEATLGREPIITTKDEDNAWAFTPEYKDIPDEENIAVVKGFDKFTVINDKFIAIDTVFTGPTSGMVQLKYVWETSSGAVINVPPKTEVKFLKPVQDKKTQDLKRMIKLNKGELEIKMKKSNSKNKFGVQTDFLDLYVIGTHFWVSHDEDKDYTLVGVYDGKVEIETKDGKTTTITPNGDKPGIFIITQEFSVIKLILSGLIVIAVIGGVVFLIRRKRRKLG